MNGGEGLETWICYDYSLLHSLNKSTVGRLFKISRLGAFFGKVGMTDRIVVKVKWDHTID